MDNLCEEINNFLEVEMFRQQKLGEEGRSNTAEGGEQKIIACLQIFLDHVNF